MNERMYRDLAPWWPLLSPPEEYAGEAEIYQGLIHCALGRAPGSLLELGSGGGHLASHLPADLDLHLVDIAAGMLEVSRALNPDRAHSEGDMRTLRLGRTFEAVLLHDAVMYLLSAEDLRAAYQTAFDHLAPGGVFLVVPDLTTESFEESTVASGGSIPGGRGAQLMEWRWDPDPADCTFQVDFAFLIRDDQGGVQCIHDPHTMGMFPRAEHVRLLREVGFKVLQPDVMLAMECGELFLGQRP